MKSLLAYPFFYNFFKFLISRNSEQHFTDTYIKPKQNQNILDIGCGPANIIKTLPKQCRYTGVDINKKYIEQATQSFSNRGTFLHGDFSEIENFEKNSFDTVLCIGLLHHLNDNEVLSLMKKVHSILKTNGKIITLDGCYTQNQSFIKKYILSRDRGNYVRTESQYSELIKQIFFNYHFEIRDDLIRIPYSHIIYTCIKQ